MSRINTNISSMQAMNRLNRNNGDLSVRLQRLASGMRINSGKDAPAALIASETLRSEIAGIGQAIDNSQRANNVINTAEGALSEVSALLLEIQSLTNEAANVGALSPEEIKANQLQVDAILNSVNRIANTTQFGGVKLLNGQLDFQTSGIVASQITDAQINNAKIPEGGTVTVAVQVTASAEVATIDYTASGIGGTPATIEISGNIGTEQLSFAASAANSAIAAAVNQLKDSTGVEAEIITGGDLRLKSTGYGSKQFVSVRTIAGTFANAKDTGVDAEVNINGNRAEVDGLEASIRNGDTDIAVTIAAKMGPNSVDTSQFTIVGGGAKFQIGSQVERQGQVQIGVTSVNTTKLGNDTIGYLSSMASGGDNSLVGGNTIAAQKVLTESIRQVATLRGRLGAFQKNILETNTNSLTVALENVTASESAIRDADFAKETAALTRAQILVQANTSVLAQANSTPQNVLALLNG